MCIVYCTTRTFMVMDRCCRISGAFKIQFKWCLRCGKLEARPSVCFFFSSFVQTTLLLCISMTTTWPLSFIGIPYTQYSIENPFCSHSHRWINIWTSICVQILCNFFISSSGNSFSVFTAYGEWTVDEMNTFIGANVNKKTATNSIETTKMRMLRWLPNNCKTLLCTSIELCLSNTVGNASMAFSSNWIPHNLIVFNLTII